MRGLAILTVAGLLLTGAATAQAAPAVGHEQFTFQFGDVTGGGQLDYPTNVRHAPVVVLIPGSGPENRDANVLGKSHIFADISAALTARGFAVMRYDKRYVHADGTVDYQDFYTKLDLPKMLDDAGTVLAAAEADQHVDRRRVFLYGWSEGSTVAAALAVKHPELAGVAFQGPVTQSWRDLFTDQATRVARPYLRTFGRQLAPADLQRAAHGGGGLVATEYIGFVAPGSYNGTDYTVSPTFDTNGDGKLDVDTEFLPGLQKTFDTAFQPGGPFAIYAPGRALPSVLDQARALSRFPTLVLQGGRDANVPPAGAFRLNAALHGDHTLRFYPTLGHSLGRTPSLFADDFQPIDQRPLDDLACWLSEHLRQE
jgi:pimeloyl-ACP methyl ester carboxylesterase